eukprot:259320-Prorocentrum_minimum.AAC.1
MPQWNPSTPPARPFPAPSNSARQAPTRGRGRILASVLAATRAGCCDDPPSCYTRVRHGDVEWTIQTLLSHRLLLENSILPPILYGRHMNLPPPKHFQGSQV